MQTGIREYARNDFEAAHQAFEEAWRLKHHTEIAASLALVEMKLGRYRDAAEHYQYYLDRIPAEATGERERVEEQLGKCREHVGQIQVSVNVPSAEIRLDDQLVGNGPLSLWVDPGLHELIAVQENRRSRTAQVTVAPGQEKQVSLKVPPIGPQRVSVLAPAPLPPMPVPQARADAGVEPRTLVVIGGAVLTAAALGTSLGYYLKSLGTEDDAQAFLDQTMREGDPDRAKTHSVCTPPPGLRPDSCDALEAEAAQFDRERKASSGFLVAGAVLGGVTLATYLLWPDSSPEPAEQPIAVLPRILGPERGVELQISF